MGVPASLPSLAPAAAFLTLLELGVGTITMAYVVDLAGHVGRGFVGSTAAICAAVVAVAIILGASLPTDTMFLTGSVNPGAMSSLVHWSIALSVLLLGFAVFCAVGTDGARRVVGAATVAVGATVVGKAAVAFGPAIGGWGGALVAIGPATLLTGSALAGMLLGHWYLVVPSMSFRPLRQTVNLVFAALIVQAVVLAAVLASASASAREQLLFAAYALPFWLLVVGAGILFTGGVNLLIRHFARIRANQPATAMLYVLIISVVMGVVPAQLLFFVTGVPV